MEEAYNSLEEMLKQQITNQDRRVKGSIVRQKNPPQKAERSADLEDFIQMVDKMVSRAMKDLNVVFMPDDQNMIIKDQSQKINSPYITHKVLERVPDGEIKHRVREQIIEQGHEEGDNRLGEVKGQRFLCEVQFNIFASEYKVAQDVMRRFEDNIERYRHFFLQNGVQRIFFKRQHEDQNYQVFRENFSVRNLIYSVTIEHLLVGFNTQFEDISI